MLGWIVAGLLIASSVGVTVIVVKGKITKMKLKEELKKRGIKDVLVDKVNNSNNEISVRDMGGGQKWEVQGDGVSDELYEGQKIYV